MYGEFVHESVLSSGDAQSGPTIFVVTEGYDEGPILAQAPVPVLPDDDVKTLAARVRIENTGCIRQFSKTSQIDV